MGVKSLVPLLFIRSLLQEVAKTSFGHALGRFYPVKVIYHFLSRFLAPHYAIRFQYYKMFLDPSDSLSLLTRGVHEPAVTNLFKKVINKGDTVLDIGAHIGYYTLMAANLVGETGKVFAFEPESDHFKLLRKNIKINHYNNVILAQKAVSNRTGRTKLFLSEGNKLDHRIYDPHDGRRSVLVDVVTLDEFFKDYDENIDFIKMDVQGAEAAALEGMSNLLNKNVNVKIVIEFWSPGLRAFGTAPEDLLRLLTKHGFRLYKVNEVRKKIEPTDTSTLFQSRSDEEWDSVLSRNLFCIRE